MRLGTYLKRNYTNPRSPIAFAGPRVVYNHVKKLGYTPTFSYIKEFVSGNDAYTMNREVRRRFPTISIIARTIHYMYDSDLCEMIEYASKNDSMKYILVIIDIFSRQLAARPLPNKSAETVKEAVKDVFDNEMKAPIIFRTDDGREYSNKIFNEYLNSKSVYHQVALGPHKASYAERIIKTLKTKISRYIVETNSERYIDQLPNFVTAYNKSYHSSIKMRPIDVTEDNAKKLFWRFYKPKSIRKPKKFTLRVGDHVRISHLRSKFDRQYWEKFTGEVFLVKRRYRRQNLQVYELTDLNGETVKGSFYRQELQKVFIPKNKVWKIDHVVKTRKRRGKTEYFVKWKYFPDSHNSWTTDKPKNL